MFRFDPRSREEGRQLEQQTRSPWPRIDVPEGRPPEEPEMPWPDLPASRPYRPDERIDHWPEMVFPGPEGIPEDDDVYNPMINPRRPPETRPWQPPTR